MKKLLAVLLALSLTLVLFSGVALGEEGKKLKIGYYGLAPTQAFFKQIWESLDAHCAERGYEFISFYTDADAAKMRSAFGDSKSSIQTVRRMPAVKNWMQDITAGSVCFSQK